jgi:hypothetical protein
VNHNHHKVKVKTTLLIENPYSEQKVCDALANTVSVMSDIDPKEYTRELETVQERCFVNGKDEKTFYHISDYPDSIRETLLAVFPGYDMSGIGLISTPSYNEVMGEEVISAFLLKDDIDGLEECGEKLITKCRKFCLTSGRYYDRCYAFCEDTFDFLPDTCAVMGKSFHMNVPEGLILPDFYDVYFFGVHLDVQTAFDLPPLEGSESTYYGVTVLDGKVIRAKQYCYDTIGIFSNWEEAIQLRKAGHGM